MSRAMFPREWAERMASLPGGASELDVIATELQRRAVSAECVRSTAARELAEAEDELLAVVAERDAVLSVLESRGGLATGGAVGPGTGAEPPPPPRSGGSQTAQHTPGVRL